MDCQTDQLLPIINSPTIDLELQRLWNEAREEFRTNTKRELVLTPPKRIEDVLAQLKDRFQSEDGGKSSTKQKIKDAIEKFLKYIQLIGGVAAEATSTVFAPATLCFNAISFLIDIPQRVTEILKAWKTCSKK